MFVKLAIVHIWKNRIETSTFNNIDRFAQFSFAQEKMPNIEQQNTNNKCSKIRNDDINCDGHAFENKGVVLNIV